MALIFDRRAALAGQAVTHAFVVGVSEYLFLPSDALPPDPATFNLKRLRSPALSAARLAEWLINHAADLDKPLATCWLLYSASALEGPSLPDLTLLPGATGAAPGPADWASFVHDASAWRGAASLSRNDATIFYFGGHGFERLGVPLLTLADFCDPAAGGSLMRGVDLPNIVGGMAPAAAFPNIARSQFYFIDACREDVDPATLRTNTGSVFDVLPELDDRATPTYQASYSGGVAMNQAGQPTDFCQALIQGLERGSDNRDAADVARRWPVTTYSLHTAISNYFAANPTGQYAPLGGTVKNERIRWLATPPPVDVAIHVDPDPAIDCTTVSLAGVVQWRQPPARALHPYRSTLPAGIYQLDAQSANPGYLPYQDQALVNQLNSRWAIRMPTP